MIILAKKANRTLFCIAKAGTELIFRDSIKIPCIPQQFLKLEAESYVKKYDGINGWNVSAVEYEE